ncbi:MAG: hypothetical protein IRZ08_12425 [Frankia sp.]|nr:hypothetical protein [Frankia sp.]
MDEDFRLRLYSVAAPSVTVHEISVADSANKCIKGLMNSRLSDELIYDRVGFFVAHFGRRGLTCLLYHFGTWVDMPEVFHAGWYRYGSDGPLEQLDFREPISCVHDIPIISHELNIWSSLALEEEIPSNYLGYLESPAYQRMS